MEMEASFWLCSAVIGMNVVYLRTHHQHAATPLSAAIFAPSDGAYNGEGILSINTPNCNTLHRLAADFFGNLLDFICF